MRGKGAAIARTAALCLWGPGGAASPRLNLTLTFPSPPPPQHLPRLPAPRHRCQDVGRLGQRQGKGERRETGKRGSGSEGTAAHAGASAKRDAPTTKKIPTLQAGATTIADTPEWKALQEHVAEIEQT
jgi:hypothetical protein